MATIAPHADLPHDPPIHICNSITKERAMIVGNEAYFKAISEMIKRQEAEMEYIKWYNRTKGGTVSPLHPPH